MTPGIVRVGVQAHHSVDSVTLETLVERKLASSADLRVCCSCVEPLLSLKFSSFLLGGCPAVLLCFGEVLVLLLSAGQAMYKNHSEVGDAAPEPSAGAHWKCMFYHAAVQYDGAVLSTSQCPDQSPPSLPPTIPTETSWLHGSGC